MARFYSRNHLLTFSNLCQVSLLPRRWIGHSEASARALNVGGICSFPKVDSQQLVATKRIKKKRLEKYLSVWFVSSKVFAQDSQSHG